MRTAVNFSQLSATQNPRLRHRNPESLTLPRPDSRLDTAHAHTDHSEHPSSITNLDVREPVVRIGAGLNRSRLSVRTKLGSPLPAPILKHIRLDSSGGGLASTSSQHPPGRSV